MGDGQKSQPHLRHPCPCPKSAMVRATRRQSPMTAKPAPDASHGRQTRQFTATLFAHHRGGPVSRPVGAYAGKTPHPRHRTALSQARRPRRLRRRRLAGMGRHRSASIDVRFRQRCRPCRQAGARSGTAHRPAVALSADAIMTTRRPVITERAHLDPSLQAGAMSTLSDLTTDALTYVDLTWQAKRIEHRIRFGHPVAKLRLDRDRRRVAFAPGSIFAVIRWAANDFGTVLSRIDILRAVGAGERCTTVPFLQPVGVILLSITCSPKVGRVLQAIDCVPPLGIDPADAPPEHWQHIHNRLSVGDAPRAYTLTRHQARLKRRRIPP